MDKNIKDRIEKRNSWKDYIVWYGTCGRCGSPRYTFVDELEKLRIDPKSDLTDREFRCKGGQCNWRVRMRGRLPAFKACHLNDIKRR